MNFTVPNIQNQRTAELARRLAIICNNLRREDGKRWGVIKIEQMDARYKKVQGIIDMDIKENRDWQKNNSPRFRTKVVGNHSLEFEEDPYPQGLVEGTGMVMYLLDDNAEVPKNAKSKATHGWNREFLASNYAMGWFRICDEEIEKEIKQRYQEIQDRLTEEEPERKAVYEDMVRRGEEIKGRNKQEHIIKHVMEQGVPASGTVTKVKEGVASISEEKINAIIRQNETLQAQVNELMADRKGKPRGRKPQAKKKSEPIVTELTDGEKAALAGKSVEKESFAT